MEKIKLFIESNNGKGILIGIIIVLVGLGSFELGRLSAKNESKGIKILYPEIPTISNQTTLNQSNSNNNLIPKNVATSIQAIPVNTTINQNINNNSNTLTGVKFLASKKGSKYYPIRCSAGKAIKLENRIYFKTEQEAITAGYSKSASCK